MSPEERGTAEAMRATAVEKLSSAQSLHELGHFNDALSRAYYAAFIIKTILDYANAKLNAGLPSLPHGKG